MKALSGGALLLCAFMAGPAHTADVQAPVELRMPKGSLPVWRGISAGESAGGQTAMLYPAPNAAGLLVSVLTHALLVNGSRASERAARQAEADKILQPHADAIAALSTDVLVAAVREQLTEAVVDRARGLVVEFQPEYALSPDRRTLVLDNAVQVRPVGDPAATRFANLVRVVSTPIESADPLAYWSANSGAELKRVAAALVAHSLTIALSPLAEGKTASFRTLRYRFGLTERMERGQPLTSGCGRIVLRTLRDSLMSVPVSRDAEATPCSEPYALPPG